MYDHPRQMTPMMPGGSQELSDMALDIIRNSAELKGALHPKARAAVVSLLRITNNYYSNLIEGHNTHPVDIERAIKRDYSEGLYGRLDVGGFTATGRSRWSGGSLPQGTATFL